MYSHTRTHTPIYQIGLFKTQGEINPLPPIAGVTFRCDGEPEC